jgi:hypothetical protein
VSGSSLVDSLWVCDLFRGQLQVYAVCLIPALGCPSSRESSGPVGGPYVLPIMRVG